MIDKLLVNSPGLQKLLQLCEVEYDGNLTITIPTDGVDGLLSWYSDEIGSRYHGQVSIQRKDGSSVNDKSNVSA